MQAPIMVPVLAMNHSGYEQDFKTGIIRNGRGIGLKMLLDQKMENKKDDDTASRPFQHGNLPNLFYLVEGKIRENIGYARNEGAPFYHALSDAYVSVA